MKKLYIYIGIGLALVVFFLVPLVKNGGEAISGYQWAKNFIAGSYSK